MATPISPRDPSLEQRTSELQVQIEQVTVTLQQLKQTQDSLQQMESRLGSLTSECASILDRWAQSDERHANAVAELHGRLSEWNDLERKLLSESASRIHQFERSVQHEWQALRQKHEEPLQKLDTQAARIAESCLSAVDAALRGFDRAETRLLAIEQEIQRQMADLSREVREALTETRQPALHVGAARPWPLDDVVRLHSELRAEANASDDPREDAPVALPAAAGLALAPAGAAAAASLPAPSLSASAAGDQDEIAPRPGVDRRAWVAVAVVVAVIVGGAMLYLRQRLDAGLTAAASRAEAAERGAEQARLLASTQIAEVRQTAEEQIATARQAALSAQLTTNVLAAPDLYRFDLVAPGGAPRASAQVLWSRSRGLVFSGSRLPAAPEGRTYQLWLMSGEGPISAGLVASEAAGPLTRGFDPPERLPRPVTGALLTLEPAGGSPQPSNTIVLSTPPKAPPTS